MDKKTWESLLSKKRLNSEPPTSTQMARSEYHKDYDRVIFSSAFRRLGRKTQVHPLSKNDHIHTRLTHSLEVGSVGRSLGIGVGYFLKDKDLLPMDVSPQEIGAIVQAACLAHDIGNPPFGHAGEYAMRHWFKENCGMLRLEKKSERNDFEIFEGNAQGFRVVTHVENHYGEGGLRLTFATLGTLVKYPWLSDHAFADSKKKFNFFQSERYIAEELFSELGLIGGCSGHYVRHPLSYLMEAADDICYKVLDIEDALELEILRFDDISPILRKMAGIKPEDYTVESESLTPRRRIAKIRSEAIDNLIRKCAHVFESNYPEIMDGNFEGDLMGHIDGMELEGVSEAVELTRENIFLNKRKIELEIGSYSTLDRILSAFIGAVNERKVNEKVSFKSQRILDWMGANQIDVTESYHHCYLKITDLVSGMTDNHATHVANQLSGLAL